MKPERAPERRELDWRPPVVVVVLVRFAEDWRVVGTIRTISAATRPGSCQGMQCLLPAAVANRLRGWACIWLRKRLSMAARPPPPPTPPYERQQRNCHPLHGR